MVPATAKGRNDMQVDNDLLGDGKGCAKSVVESGGYEDTREGRHTAVELWELGLEVGCNGNRLEKRHYHYTPINQ